MPQAVARAAEEAMAETGAAADPVVGAEAEARLGMLALGDIRAACQFPKRSLHKSS